MMSCTHLKIEHLSREWFSDMYLKASETLVLKPVLSKQVCCCCFAFCFVQNAFAAEAKVSKLFVDCETGGSWHVLCHSAMVSMLFLCEKQRKEADPRRVRTTEVLERGKGKKEMGSGCLDRCP